MPRGFPSLVWRMGRGGLVRTGDLLPIWEDLGSYRRSARLLALQSTLLQASRPARVPRADMSPLQRTRAPPRPAARPPRPRRRRPQPPWPCPLLSLLSLVTFIRFDSVLAFHLPTPLSSVVSSSHSHYPITTGKIVKPPSRQYFTPPKQQEAEAPTQEEQQPFYSSPSSNPLALPSSQYDELMEALSNDEKYNILLQSRAASLVQALGNKGKGRASVPMTMPQTFQPIYKLIEEMTEKNVRITPKSFAALVDAASLSRDLSVIQKCMLLARRNGASRVFARGVGTLSPPPPLRASVTAGGGAGGGGGAAAAEVDALPPVPHDERTSELGAGVAALTVLGGALMVEALGPLVHVDTWPATVVLIGAAVAAGLDLSQRQGEEVKLMLAGLNRMFMKDPEREARVQAATFLSAYLLGLPCFCFSPNVIEAVKMTTDVEEFAEVLSSPVGMNRVLVYLLAPVVVEEANHLQLIVSDPRQARALIQICRERRRGREGGREGEADKKEDERLLRWAYAEARRVVAMNSGLLERLRQRMESGGATVGDCVALLESGGGGGGEGGGGGGRRR